MTRLCVAALVLFALTSAVEAQTVFEPAEAPDSKLTVDRLGYEPYEWLDPRAAARLRSLQEPAPIIVIQVEGGNVNVVPLDRRMLRELRLEKVQPAAPATERSPLYFRMDEILRGDDTPEFTDPNTREISDKPQEEPKGIIIFPKKGDPATPSDKPQAGTA